MDFKPEKFKKGELVRYFQLDDTLGIVIGQDGSKVTVQWVSWPEDFQYLSVARGPLPMYKVKRVKG